MHLGSVAIIADKAPENFVHVIFNNGAHDSVGGQPTVGLKVNLAGIAKAAGYKDAVSVTTAEDLDSVLKVLKTMRGPARFYRNRNTAMRSHHRRGVKRHNRDHIPTHWWY